MGRTHQPFLTDLPQSEPVTDKCPLCEGEKPVLDYYTGEVICTICGCVLNDLVVNRDKNGLTYTEVPESTESHGSAISPSIYDKGLSTVIMGNKDAYGTRLSKETLTDMRRLQKHDNRSKINDSISRNLSIAMTELDRLTSALGLPHNVKENAATIYRKTLKEDLIRGRSIDSFVAASVYTACRMQNIPRPLKTVAEESKREYQEVSMTYRLILKELNLKPPIDDPLKYVPKLAAKIGVSRQTELRAIEVLQLAREQQALTGKDPRGLSAAAIYLASQESGEHIVQRTIAKAAETTEVTLRNRYRGLKKALKLQ